MKNKYPSLAAFRSARIAARLQRDHFGNELAARWALVQDPRSRGALLRDAVGDVLLSWKPYRHVHELLHGRVSGSTVAAVGMALASTRSGIFKRVLYSGISMLLGKMIGDAPQAGPGLLSTLATAVGSSLRRIRERKAGREREEEKDIAERPIAR